MLRRPHIVFLLADQLRWDVLGYNGSARLLQRRPPLGLTPRLDTLASLSTAFDRHFTPCPLCVPARSCLFTGLPQHRHGAIINGWLPHERRLGTIRGDAELLPQHLIDAGYRVVHVGVQHVHTDPPLPQRLPKVEFVGPAGMSEHWKELRGRRLMLPEAALFRDPVIDFEDGKPVVTSGTNATTHVFPLREEHFYDVTLTRKMVEAIERHRSAASSVPLALFGMFWLPHPPFMAPQPWAGLIDPQEVNLPAAVGRWFGGMPALQLANFPGQMGAHVSMSQWRKAWAMYLGMVALLDQCVGKVLAALDHAGMLDDALVIFSSDHGEMLGSHRLLQKMCLYEEAVRVPTLIKPPGPPASRHSQRTAELTDHLDLTATMLAAAGCPHSRGAPGRSLLPLCQAGGGQHSGSFPASRQVVFAAYDGNAGRGFAHRMARSRTHKLIHNIGDRPELYDLVDDPHETVNRAGQPDVASVQAALRDALRRWMDECGDDAARP